MDKKAVIGTFSVASTLPTSEALCQLARHFCRLARHLANRPDIFRPHMHLPTAQTFADRPGIFPTGACTLPTGEALCRPAQAFLPTGADTLPTAQAFADRAYTSKFHFFEKPLIFPPALRLLDGAEKLSW